MKVCNRFLRDGTRGFGLVGLVVWLALLGGLAWGVLNHQILIDRWHIQNFTPSERVAELAATTTMNDYGRNLFYASQPELAGKDTFSRFCRGGGTGEATIVLGCYALQRIYIFDVTDARLDGVEEVTAAHEMLHAAYERMSSYEKRQLDNLLEPQTKQLHDQRIIDLINLYKREEPDQLYNEIHSILGTESRELSPELEVYYQKYFTDRKKVVAFSEQYEAVLSASKKRITVLDGQLAALKTQINAYNDTLGTQQAELTTTYTHLSSLRAEGRLAEYNAAVPDYNNQVRNYNTLIELTKGLIGKYNTLVAERNQEAAAQNDLYQSLNSNYQTVPTNLR